MKLDIRSDKVLYIEIENWTYCIDDSTGEHLISRWKTNDLDHSFTAEWEKEE